MEKERSKRIYLGLKAELFSNSKSYLGVIPNLSVNGICLYVETTPTEIAINFASGEKLELKFQTPSGETINLHCELEWLHINNNPPDGFTYKMGLEIIESHSKYREFIKTLL